MEKCGRRLIVRLLSLMCLVLTKVHTSERQEHSRPSDVDRPPPECVLLSRYRSGKAPRYQSIHLTSADMVYGRCPTGVGEEKAERTLHVLDGTLTLTSEDAHDLVNRTGLEPCIALRVPPLTMIEFSGGNTHRRLKTVPYVQDSRPKRDDAPSPYVHVTVNNRTTKVGLGAAATAVEGGEVLVDARGMLVGLRKDPGLQSLTLTFRAVPSCAKGQLQVQAPKQDFFESQMDLVFILDTSTSVYQPDFLKMKKFVRALVSTAEINSGRVRVGVITYSTKVDIEFYLDSFTTKRQVLSAVSRTRRRYGSTNTADALLVMRTQLFTEDRGDRPGIPNYAILITDGVSNINSRRTIPEADKARREGIQIFVIGINLWDTREVDGIAYKPDDKHRFLVPNFDDLSSLRNKIYLVISPGYIQTFNWNGQQKHYPFTHACTTIRAPPSHVIMISFVSLDFDVLPSPRGEACPSIFLQVYLTPECRGPPEHTICQYTDALPAVYQTDFLSVRLQSRNGHYIGTGLRLLFSFHSSANPPQRLSNGRWVCSGKQGPMLVQHFICSMETFCVNAEDNTGACLPSDLCGYASVVIHHRCYRYVRPVREVTWTEANEACRANKGYLASLNSQLEWEGVSTFSDTNLKDFLMIGLARGAHNSMPDMYSSLWQWSDKTIAYFMSIHYPSKAVYPPYCAVFEVGRHYLTVSSCNSPMPANYLCEMEFQEEEFSQHLEIVLPTPSRRASTLSQMTECPNNDTTYTFLQCNWGSHCYGDGENEINQCLREYPQVAETMFTCTSQTQQVHYTLVCNHHTDCTDGSDEDFCVQPPCRADDFSCWKTKQCLSRDLRCDGVQQCMDGSDEQWCGETMEVRQWTTVPPPAIVNFTDFTDSITISPVNISDSDPICPETHFQCPPNGYCLPVYVRCNSVLDCPGGEDEANCGSYTCPGFYRCQGAHTCLHADHVCDGSLQCPQHDDELVCELDCPVKCTCLGFAFTCLNRFPAATCPQLRYLKADNTGMNLHDVANNTQLIYLSLRFCNIKKTGIVFLPNIQSLDLSYNSLTTIAYQQLERMRNLKSLSLAFNKLISLDTIQHVGVVYHDLIFLDLSGGNTREITNTSFLAFPDIQHLNLSGSKLEIVWAPGFNALPYLKVLDLSECPVTDFHGNLFKSLTGLEVIHASQFHMCCPAILPEGFNHGNCHAPADEVSSCTALLRADIFRVFLVMYALFALLGNFISFVYRVFGKGITVKLGFDIFVTQLCVADFLMGVYLAIVGIADRIYYGTYEWNDIRWKQSTACQIAGFLSLVSSEVSAFFICFITLERFLLIQFPHKKLHFTPKSALVACIIAWVAGLLLAAIPLLPFTPPWDFYSQTGICVPLPITRKVFPGSDYAFAVMIVFNFFLFLLIATGQFLIFWSIQSQTKAVNSSSKKAKDMAIARRLLAVVMTDFLCWFPIGLLGLMARNGVPISGDVNVAMAIFVLPFNSAINPFLYTFHMLIERRRMAQAKSSDTEKTVPSICTTCAQQGLSQDASSSIKAQGPSHSAAFNENESTVKEALKLIEQILEENLMTPERLQSHISHLIRNRNSVTTVNVQATSDL